MKHQFLADGHKIAYGDTGQGDPIILLHGFGADSWLNWHATGWHRLLLDAGFRVITMDARGHGRSDKPLAVEAYAPEGAAGDVIRLMDHLELEQADLFGYSMGARNLAWLLCHFEERLSSAVIGGAGINVLHLHDPGYWEGRGFELTADNRQGESLARPWLKPLLGGIRSLGGTPAALSACLLGSFAGIDPALFGQVQTPTLVVAGERDSVAGSPIPLAESIPGAQATVVPGRTHLSTLTDPFFKGAVLGFLGDRQVSQSQAALAAAS